MKLIKKSNEPFSLRTALSAKAAEHSFRLPANAMKNSAPVAEIDLNEKSPVVLSCAELHYRRTMHVLKRLPHILECQGLFLDMKNENTA